MSIMNNIMYDHLEKESEKMVVLVTGGTGFVGQHLIPRLIKNGYSVKCLVRNEKKAALLKEKYDVETVIGDVTDQKSLEGITDGVDYVVHLAAIGHVSAVSEEAFNLFTGVNEGGTKYLIQECQKGKTVKKFIHFSSTAAMGPIGLPILNEESVPNPVTPYQKSKNRSEKIVMDAFHNGGFPGLIVRPCMIYGPGGYGEFYKFCRLMKKGIFPKVGLGKNLTPLVYVEDVVTATIYAIEKGIPGNSYIIASNESIPMDKMRSLIMKAIGKKAPYIFVPSFVALGGAKFIEIVSSRLGKEPIVTEKNIKSTIVDRTFDISKARSELGYESKYSFEEGISRTIRWYKKQGKI